MAPDLRPSTCGVLTAVTSGTLHGTVKPKLTVFPSYVSTEPRSGFLVDDDRSYRRP